MSLCKQVAAVSGTQRIYTAIIVRGLKPVKISFILRISLWRQIWVTIILLLILYRGVRQSIKQTIICLFYQVQAAAWWMVWLMTSLTATTALILKKFHTESVRRAWILICCLSIRHLWEVLKLRRRCLCVPIIWLHRRTLSEMMNGIMNMFYSICPTIRQLILKV